MFYEAVSKVASNTTGCVLSSSVISGVFGCILNHFWWHSVLLRHRKRYSGRFYTTFDGISKVYAAFDVVFWGIHDHLVATFDTNSLSYCRLWWASADGEAVTDPNGHRLEETQSVTTWSTHRGRVSSIQQSEYPLETVAMLWFTRTSVFSILCTLVIILAVAVIQSVVLNSSPGYTGKCPGGLLMAFTLDTLILFSLFYYRDKSLVETSNPNGARRWMIILRMFILCVWVKILVSGNITHCVCTVVSDNCELLAFCLDLLQNSVFSLSLKQLYAVSLSSPPSQPTHGNRNIRAAVHVHLLTSWTMCDRQRQRSQLTQWIQQKKEKKKSFDEVFILRVMSEIYTMITEI